MSVNWETATMRILETGAGQTAIILFSIGYGISQVLYFIDINKIIENINGNMTKCENGNISKTIDFESIVLHCNHANATLAANCKKISGEFKYSSIELNKCLDLINKYKKEYNNHDEL